VLRKVKNTEKKTVRGQNCHGTSSHRLRLTARNRGGKEEARGGHEKYAQPTVHITIHRETKPQNQGRKKKHGKRVHKNCKGKSASGQAKNGIRTGTYGTRQSKRRTEGVRKKKKNFGRRGGKGLFNPVGWHKILSREGWGGGGGRRKKALTSKKGKPPSVKKGTSGLIRLRKSHEKY